MSSQGKIDEDLFNACINNDLNRVRALLVCGGNPCVRFPQLKDDGQKIFVTAFHVPNMFDDKRDNILKEILSSGRVTDIDILDNGGNKNTALEMACVSGNIKCAQILVDNGADVLHKDKMNDSCVHASAYSGSAAMMKQCLKWKGININERGDKNWTPLHYACEKGVPDVVQVLLEAGANSELVDEDDFPPLWYAKDNKQITDLFVKYMKQETSKKSVAQQRNSTDRDLNTSFGAMSISGQTKRINEVISNVFPNSNATKINSILSALEKSGIDLNDLNPEQFRSLEKGDLSEVLKPIEERMLLKALKTELGYEGGEVFNF